MAPELMKHEPHNVAVDVYSWALVSWEMLMVDRVFSFESKERFVEVRVAVVDKLFVVCPTVLLARA